MQQLLSRDRAEVGEAVGADERAARAQLRTQVGRLERELGRLAAEAFPRLEIECGVVGSGPAPRLLDLGDLERVRDDLADRISEARRALAARAEFEARNRELLAALLEAPEKHRGLEIGRADVGEPGCGGWRSVPRCGLVGMLMGWWRVKVSSGCPLAGRLAAVEQQLEEEARRQAAAQGTAADEAVAEFRCRRHGRSAERREGAARADG